MPDYNKNISAVYSALQQQNFSNIGTEEEFAKRMQNKDNRKAVYDAMSSMNFSNLGTYDEFEARFAGGEKPRPASISNVSLNPAMEQAAKEAMTPEPQPQQAEQTQAAPAAQPAAEPVRQEAQPAEPEVNPFPYSGGLEQEMEEIARLRETVAEDKAFVDEYEARQAETKKKVKSLSNVRGDVRNSADLAGGNGENLKWLKDNKDRYKQAKANVEKVESVVSGPENAINKAEAKIAQRKNREEMASPEEIIATGRTAFGGDNAGRRDSEHQYRTLADELYASAEQEYDKSSKYQEGYDGNFWEQLWTGAKDYAADFGNNIDSGSFTFGLSKGLAEVKAREVGDKYNALIDDTIKEMDMSEEEIKSTLSTLESSVPKLEALEKELGAAGAEIDAMAATYEDMVSRDDPGAEAYGRRLQAKIDAYNKRINEEYKPTWDAYESSRTAYQTVMDAIDEAVATGLTGGEKALLDALEKFTQAKTLRSDDVSVAGKAGAGFEQTAEFMLDFILTGGITKAGTRLATKLAKDRAIKKYGAGVLKELAAKGQSIAPGIVAKMVGDVAATAGRMVAVAPRSIQAFGDNLTEYPGKDYAGRIKFDRSQANAFANTLLTQYIEYWSEGFGEYFGDAERALFRGVTRKAPKAAIGSTLRAYRGSIGTYLDKGKFDGMFNEMLEEVVGSTFNSLAGWMSGDRVGDADAMKEFFAGENLATLALSFLPMSAIGAATNLSAYHNMKERHDRGAEMLNQFIQSGALNQEELQNFVEELPNLSPAEAKDRIVDMTDRARTSNGGQLPTDFAQNLLGYVEGEFAMGLRYDEWENSMDKMSVVNAYTDAYANPDPRLVWDANENEKNAWNAAVDAGFSSEELRDTDAYMLAQEAFEMRNTDPARADILMEYASAKAGVEGLRMGYEAEGRQYTKAYEDDMREHVSNNDVITTAVYTLNGVPTPVYIVQEDAAVDSDGALTTPTGKDGQVKFIPLGTQNKGDARSVMHAKASEFSAVATYNTEEYIAEREKKYNEWRAGVYETALNTPSPAARARALDARVGHTVVVSDGKGVYQPFKVERMTNGGSKVVISGDKKALQGVAERMGMRVPTSGYLEPNVTDLYPLLAKEEDGSLSTGLGETTQQEAAPAAEQAAGLGDLRDQTVPIFDEGQVRNAHVIDVSDGSVIFEEVDENGDVMRTVRLPEADFERAMQEAANPAPVEAPAAEETVAEEAPAPAAVAIPVDEKTGEKIYDAPGVAVEDAIADLYATEGLTEADVDQYIADEAAKAEAARNPERGKMSPQAWGQAKQEAARKADFWAAMAQAAAARKQPAAPVQEEAPVETAPAAEVQPEPAPAPARRAKTSKRARVARAKQWEKRTGVKVKIANSIDEVENAAARQALENGENVAGWYDRDTDTVGLYLPNNASEADIDVTYIHEVVSHRGLEVLLGKEGYAELCDRVWNELMTDREQQFYLDYNSHLSGSEEYLRRAAADEYIAHFSETLDLADNRNAFERFVDWVMELLGLSPETKDAKRIEASAIWTATGSEVMSRDVLSELLRDSLLRYEAERREARERAEAKPLTTGALSEDIQAELDAKGEVMDGGVVMDQNQAVLKKVTGYKTPNELDMEASPTVGDVRMSKTTLPAWAQNYMKYADAKEHVVKVVENFNDRCAADELVNGVVPQGTYNYGEKSSGGFAGPLRTNIEYVVTFDMDTSCPRSLQYLEYVKMIEARIGRPMTQREMVQLTEMMRVYGQMIPCVYCYCENKRQALKQYYHDFLASRRGVINAKTEEEALEKMYGHATTKEARESKDPEIALNKAAYEVFQEWRNGKQRYNPTIEQLWMNYRDERNAVLSVLDEMLNGGRLTLDLTDEVIKNRISKELNIDGKDAKAAVKDIVSEWKWNRIEGRKHSDFTRLEDEDMLYPTGAMAQHRDDVLALWRQMTSYGKSASQAKNVMRYVPYTDELKTLSQEQKDYINGMGGLRMHSSNDFRIDYVLDYFQFMADMEMNGMFGHTYTKSPEFVRIFGNSGYKINMSIAAYEDENGIRPNLDEGFDWEDARRLREQFPNAGVMLMATSDAQIQLALDSDWIDMFIPFHASGLPKTIWYDMRMWTDYTSSQNERFLNSTEMREELEADGVSVPKDANSEEVTKLYNEHFNIHVETYYDKKDKKMKRVRPHFLPGKTVVNGVDIPGHGNSYEEYMRLCREWGVRPRFYGIKVKDNTPEGGGREVDISEHPAYMKCIKETARTDTPQTAIKFNFDEPSEALGGRSPMDYAFEELQRRAEDAAKAAGEPARDIYAGLKQDKLYGIVPHFIRSVINHEAEFKKRTGKELPYDFLDPDSRKWFMTERKALEEAYKDVDTIPYHPHTYDENGNLIMEPEIKSEDISRPTDEGGTVLRKVTDPAKIAELEAEEKVPVYRSALFVPDPDGDVEYDLGDGKGLQKGFLYPPMSVKVDGKFREPLEPGTYDEAEERPDLATDDGYFYLISDNGDKMKVAYAPYLHNRVTPLNEQFSAAYRRNLVVIRSLVPKSELSSNYSAEKSKKSTGMHDWSSGSVSNALAKEGKDTRKVVLSRWAKIGEPVPYDKVADEIADLIGDRDLAFEYNVVSPGLRKELVKRGIRFEGWHGNPPKNVDDIIAGIKAENESIANTRLRKVEPISDNSNEALFDAAKKKFGVTKNLAEAGYALPDGTMLDFSGRHWVDPKSDSSWLNGLRQVDHREIKDLAYESDGNTPTGIETNMSDFIRRGAIRLNKGVINLATKPTSGQAGILWSLIEKAGGDVDVDFGDGYNSDHYVSYDHARPERILNDIRRYFDEEVRPEGNARFRKAPNGKPSNLTPQQWQQVRTPEFKAWFGDWEAREFLLSDRYVSELTGNEFEKDGVPLTEKVPKFYQEEYGGVINRSDIGDVILDKGGVRDSIAHGIGRNKSAAFAAVPDVIKHGMILDSRSEWKGEKMESHVIAAPISIADKGYTAVVVIRREDGKKDNRFYLHEVILQESLQDEGFKTGEPDPHRGDIANILRKILNASKIVDENGEPRVVYHGTKWNPLVEEPGKAVFDVNRVGDNFDFVDIDWNFFFTASEASARGYGNAVPVFLNMRNPEIHTIIQETDGMEMDEETGHDTVINAHDAGSEYDQIAEVKNPDGVIYTIRLVHNEEALRRFNEAAKAWEAEHKGEIDAEQDAIRKETDEIWEQIDEERRRLYEESRLEEFFGASYDEMKSRNEMLLSDVVKSMAAVNPKLDDSKLKELEAKLTELGNRELKIFQRIGIEGRPIYEDFANFSTEEDYRQTDMFALDNPNQIKSATDNNGEFDPNNPDIRFRVSPKQDKEYMDAVNAGDMEKAQRMVDEAAGAAGYTIHAYHGTDSEDGEMPFTVFKDGHFTDDYGFASYYNDEYIYDVYIKMDNPLEYDFKGQNSDWALGENGDRITTHRVFNRAVEEGYDGVILTNVDEYGNGIEEEDGEYPGSVTDYIPATPNQIKSADPVTYDDNGNVIPLSERFNEENEDIRFSIRGVVGAMNDEVAMQNLDVAEEMEREGKDAQTIWAATGWEKGADGKWRNEIKDATPKEFDAKKKDLTVSDIVNAPELFESYPQLKDIKVAIKKMANAAGAYNPGENSINLDTVSSVSYRMSDEQREEINKDVLDKIRSGELYTRTKVANYRAKLEKKVGKPILDEEGMSIILHELQHAIQRVEGFARGGNTANEKQRIFLDAIAEDQNAGTFAHFFLRTNAANKLLTIGKERIVKAISDNISRYSEKDQEYLQALSDYLSSCTEGEFRSLLSKAAGIARRAKRDAGDNYLALAGEVEARNVEKRRRMSEEERKSIPLSETEDTPRYYQTVRFRKAPTEEERTAESAQAGYEGEIRRKVTDILLEWQNQDLPVRVAMNKVMIEVGMENLPESADYLTRHNIASSQADSQMHEYKLFYYEPMFKAIGEITNILVGGKPSVLDASNGRKQRRVNAYNDLVNYCYAMSGLERNEWKRAEARQLMAKELERLADKWEKESEAIHADSRLTEEERDRALNRAEERYAKERSKIAEKYADRDYSGITGLMGREKEEWEEAENEARAMIAEFQRKVNNNDLLEELWDRIRACTDFNLKHAYKYGLLSRAEYERLRGTESQPRMWNYYIPLRGFKGRTAEDEYTYTMFSSDASGGEVIKKAKGRTTEADDPFATMFHISELEIVQGLHNWAKQALYNFVLTAGDNSLLTQVEPWYVKEQGSDNWHVAEPNEGETLEKFEARMQEVYEKGEARRGRNGLKLGHIMANPMHRNQHMIRLKVNGAEKMIWVHGDTVLPMAVNGVAGWDNKILNRWQAANRRLSKLFTTFSPTFLLRNKSRDTQFALIAALVQEDWPYKWRLIKNWAANDGYIPLGYPMIRLISMWESGKLMEKENLTKREQMFLDFMRDGGATGYTMIHSMDNIKRELEQMVKNAGQPQNIVMKVIGFLPKWLSAFNEGAELLTRFTFYQTSRQMGRSHERSAYDAKESSVNFNRRGLRSGKDVNGILARIASYLYLFINPAIQGLDRWVRLHKSHPWRMGIVDASYFALGFFNSMINAMLAGFSDGSGDDDDQKMGPDWYWNIPEWVRRSNMILASPFGKVAKWGYFAIALPIEYKGFYAMGELVSAIIQGRYAAKDAPTIANEVIGVVAELMPVNPVEGYTPGDNPAMSLVRNFTPDILAPILDVATNRSFAGIPLWKENIYDETEPLSQTAFASTPEILNKAVIKLSEVSSTWPWHIDIPSGAVRGILKGYGGGAYTLVEGLGKFVFADEAHPRHYGDLPFVGGITGYLEEDRRNSFNTNALQRYKDMSNDVVTRVRSAAPGEAIDKKVVYEKPDSLPKNARVTLLLHNDEYVLGKMYYDGMKERSGEKELRVNKNGNVYTAGVKDDLESLRKDWKKAKEQYLEIAKNKNASDEEKDAAEKKAMKAWLDYTQKEDSLVDRLLEEEYNHVKQKMDNGLPYEPKETLGEKAYKLTNKK